MSSRRVPSCCSNPTPAPCAAIAGDRHRTVVKLSLGVTKRPNRSVAWPGPTPKSCASRLAAFRGTHFEPPVLIPGLNGHATQPISRFGPNPAFPETRSAVDAPSCLPPGEGAEPELDSDRCTAGGPPHRYGAAVGSHPPDVEALTTMGRSRASNSHHSNLHSAPGGQGSWHR